MGVAQRASPSPCIYLRLAHAPYFSYLPPEGFWNLWNMLLLRVPIGVAVGALLVRAGKYKEKPSLLTTVLIGCAALAAGFYAAMFIFSVLREMVQH
jgi:zinc transporter ZupT